MRNLAAILIAVWAACTLAASASGANEETTVVLHARPLQIGCGWWESQFDCETTLPNTTVEPLVEVVVDVLLRNYDAVLRFQGRLFVTEGDGVWGDWQQIATGVDCQENQLSSAYPGPTSGDLVTTFDCIAGGGLAQLGWIRFVTGTRGCLTVGDLSGFPIEVFGCPPAENAPIAAGNRGSVCVGSTGYDACVPVPVPVAATTWGNIKGQYRVK